MKKVNKIIDGVSGAWEKLTTDQTSRTGQSAARVASALANGVDAEVLALQATKNSKKNNPDKPETFSEADINSVAKWHNANRTRAAITKKQAAKLIQNQRPANGGLAPSPSTP